MSSDVSGNLGHVNNDTSEKNSEAASKDLPEYLKQKLRARGILKEGSTKHDLSRTDKASLFFTSLSPIVPHFLFCPCLIIVGCVEIKSIASGLHYLIFSGTLPILIFRYSFLKLSVSFLVCRLNMSTN